MLFRPSTVVARWLSLLGVTRTSSWPSHISWTEPPPSARNLSPEPVLAAFASMSVEQAVEHLQTHKDGLTHDEALTRRAIKGTNVLPTRGPPSWPLTLLGAIPNPFNILLLFLATINASVPNPDWAEVTILLVMVVISVVVRFWQEYRGSLAVFRLQSSTANSSRVRRQLSCAEVLAGKVHQVTGHVVMERDLVPGDIPVDLDRRERARGQGSKSHSDKAASLFDLPNIALMGTGVVSGSGLALALRTGSDVLIAGVAKELERKREKNAFQKGIVNVSWLLIGFMCVMVPVVLCISGRTTGDWNAAALFSISVAVGLVPEMLPAIVNANLARAAHVLSKMKAIVKRLDSVQNLGGMTVLCSDKTGTLTKDEVTLSRYLDCTGADSVTVLKLATVNADAQGSNGNNMDSAILSHRLRDGRPVSVAQYEKVAAIPFTFERRRSACVVRGATGQNLLICKGAFDEVLGLCWSVRQGGVVVPLDGEKKKALVRRANALNQDGYRVLLVAEKQLAQVDMEDEDGLSGLETQMTLEGMLSFIDPPKDDAAESIAQLKALGVEVKVLTGDSLPVALNVCQSLGLLGPNEETGDDVQAITGPELAVLEESGDLDAMVKTCKVFAKLTPRQKALVVGRLRDAGHCVGMLGDGINDCMALRKADVGISVDSRASIAKDCADLILTEKGLGIIVTSVRTGRITHGNTIKYIKMVASSNFGNVFSVVAASAWLPYQPMTSLQILAQNLLYDISQIAIPWDHMDLEYVETPKSWNTPDLLRFVVILGPTSSVIDMLTFLLGWFYYGVKTASDLEAVKMFRAHWFIQGLVTQTLIVHLLRTAKFPFFQSRAAKQLCLSTAVIVAIGFAVPWIPAFQNALEFARPAPSFVGFLVSELLSYCIQVQIVKEIYVRVFETWL